jgi:hypothetical protein
MTLEIKDQAWDRHIYVVGLNRLMGFQPSLLDNWISNYICNVSLPSEADRFTEIVKTEAEQILPGVLVQLTGGFRR